MLPILWAALLFSEAGGDVGTGCLAAGSPGGNKQEGREKEFGITRNISTIFLPSQLGYMTLKVLSNSTILIYVCAYHSYPVIGLRSSKIASILCSQQPCVKNIGLPQSSTMQTQVSLVQTFLGSVCCTISQ